MCSLIASRAHAAVAAGGGTARNAPGPLVSLQLPAREPETRTLAAVLLPRTSFAGPLRPAGSRGVACLPVAARDNSRSSARATGVRSRGVAVARGPARADGDPSIASCTAEERMPSFVCVCAVYATMRRGNSRQRRVWSSGEYTLPPTLPLAVRSVQNKKTKLFAVP